MANDLESKAINVIRGLAMDAVQKANSGHPGTAMALAPLAHVLHTRIMRYDATEPGWPDRDRFILSAGHASMLLYSMLYLTGFGLELDDIKQFRQWGSRTAGHPEHGHAPGIEVTTGPLGQGFANGVGMAIAEANLRARFGADLCDHRIFAICSDGDLSEGISHEAGSLAGHLKLGRLVYVYDDNHITIDGATEIALSDDAGKRFEAYGWHVIHAGEVSEDTDALEAALREGIAEVERPTLIILRSHIGYPSPNFTDTPKAHGEALGADEVARVKEILGMPAEDFWVPDDVLEFYRQAGRRGGREREGWSQRLERVRTEEPERAEEYELCLAGRGRAGWEQKLPSWPAGEQVATRAACADALGAIAGLVPSLIGGGADLTGNTGTKLGGFGVFSPEDRKGRQIYWGVREHGMGGAMNGMALHGGALPFGGTFLIFSDYMRGSVRLAALEQARTCFVWSHDSVGLGEDGPTHQPIEHLASLRAIPTLRVIRPADANETAQCWRIHVNSDGPSAFILSRQKLPVLEGTAERAEAGVARGAYVLVDEPGADLDLVLIGTGSEVSVCVGAQKLLTEQGVSARVVSMPCWELFELNSPEERAVTLPRRVPTLAVEAATTLGWERFADDVVGLDRFGASAPGDVALKNLGFTAENVADRALALLAIGGWRPADSTGEPPGLGGATGERTEQP
ncbi:MAG: transketolase [Actinomycetota bacterium]|nr:transketolase [Actinomycetota bacterium]